MVRHLPKALIALATFALVVVLLPSVAGARDVQEEAERISGEDRIDTAARIARHTFPEGETPDAVVARSDDWPDALAGSGLAGAVGGPIVLVRTDALPPVTAETLDFLAVQRVFIMGGAEAVSPEVEQALRDRGHQTVRVAGDNRYQTAAETARQVAGRAGIGMLDGQRAVFVATGDTFADSLSVGPGAYANPTPVVLTSPDRLRPAARQAITDVNADFAVLVGGPAALSVDVRRELDDMGLRTGRLAGRDRTDTSQEVATFFERELGFGPSTTLFVRGDAFPDGLAAAPHGGMLDAPLLLSRAPDSISYDVLQWVVDRADEQPGEAHIEIVRALGGPAAFSDRLLQRVAEAAAPPNAVYTYSVDGRGQGISAAELAFFSEHADWTLTDQRGWALDNDVRWDRTTDAGAADLNLHLATPEEVAAADPACSPDWSCQPAGTNDVYVNVERWRNKTSTYASRSLDDYRHYVVLHEIGHAPPMNFGHIRCEDYYANPEGDEPAPVMEQQSQSEDVGERCTINVWPLQGELDDARAALL